MKKPRYREGCLRLLAQLITDRTDIGTQIIFTPKVLSVKYTFSDISDLDFSP